MSKYKVLLYYKYVSVTDPVELMKSQREFCEKHNLKGRIIVAEEGINGTIGGHEKDTNAYVEYMLAQSEFSDMQFKISDGTQDDFPRLSVKVRPEIVSTHLQGEEAVNPFKDPAPYIYPEELHTWFKEGKEFHLVDMRNTYEYKVGRFEDSIDSTFDHFRDLPEVIKKIEHLKDKEVVTACTGGIRCEKASGYLVKHGFKKVHQLYGGMQTYMQKYPGDDFLGKLYVFDGRVTVDFDNGKNHVVVGECDKCGEPCETYVNCGLPTCNKHFLCCENCFDKEINKPFCSVKCKNNFISANVHSI